MFERYTEKARRAIFFAHFEASQYGSALVQPEHLLLGVLREHVKDFEVYLGWKFCLPATCTELEKSLDRKPISSTSVEVPLSPDGKRALQLAAEEADCCGHTQIGAEHRLLGLLR